MNRIIAETTVLETNLVSVERVHEYSSLPSEVDVFDISGLYYLTCFQNKTTLSGRAKDSTAIMIMNYFSFIKLQYRSVIRN